MTYEELNAAHVAELLALGVQPEELEAVLAAEDRTGLSFAESLRLQREQPALSMDIMADAIECGFVYEEDDG
ncbi:hypothetical protein [Megasphaera stantonii]|jgi:hypothetical protein|uniref:hypothetical protein n=1 Tax=Megasphaera stantonii TaxID=2144175 RepID=UPI00294270D9|nr:hypothetical protein [Megasphaera stantonii]